MGFAELKLPEGAVPFDDATQAKFLDIVNKDMSPKDRAQALVDMQAEIYTKASETASQQWDTYQTEQQNRIKNDPVVGGAKFSANSALVNQLVTQYGTPGLNQVLADTGAGNRIELFSFLLSLAPHVLEGGGVTPGTPPAKPVNPETRMYPSMTPKT